MTELHPDMTGWAEAHMKEQKENQEFHHPQEYDLCIKSQLPKPVKAAHQQQTGPLYWHVKTYI